jgi:hypothetical protein
MGGGVCGCCISVVVMLLIFEVVDVTALPLCHVSNFQDKVGRLRWRVAVKRKFFCPSRTPLENYQIGSADSLLMLHNACAASLR